MSLFPSPLRRLSGATPEAFDRLMAAGAFAGTGTRGRARFVVLSRALYRFRHFDLRAVRPSERAQALKLQLSAWSPFEFSEYLVGLQGPDALVFAWEREPVSKALQEQGWGSGRSICPEGLLRVPGEDGVRLQACLDGWEGQVWKERRLLQSQWWPSPPDQSSWQMFLRTRAAQDWRDSLPTIVTVPWSLHPWVTCRSLERLENSFHGFERRLTLLVCSVIAAVAGMQSHSLANAYMAWSTAQSEREVLKERTSGALELRTEALVLSSASNLVARAMQGPQPLQVMAQLASALPEKGVVLQQLALDSGKLRIVMLLSPEVQRSAIVRQMQAGGYFLDVQESRETLPGGAVAFDLRLPVPADGVPPVPAQRASGPGGPGGAGS
jgi:hypothetical protein